MLTLDEWFEENDQPYDPERYAPDYLLSRPTVEIDREFYDHIVNYMDFPYNFDESDGVSRFTIDEQTTYDIRAQVAEYRGRYFFKYVYKKDKRRYISKRMIEAIIGGP